MYTSALEFELLVVEKHVATLTIQTLKGLVLNRGSMLGGQE